MIVPLVIFVACFAGGIYTSTRYLPELDAGIVGGIAYFLVCGLLGAALSLVGLHLYSLVNELERAHELLNKGEIFADELSSLMFDVGSVTGLAAIVYLLAPKLSRSTANAPVASMPAPGDR